MDTWIKSILIEAFLWVSQREGGLVYHGAGDTDRFQLVTVRINWKICTSINTLIKNLNLMEMTN